MNVDCQNLDLFGCQSSGPCRHHALVEAAGDDAAYCSDLALGRIGRRHVGPQPDVVGQVGGAQFLASLGTAAGQTSTARGSPWKAHRGSGLGGVMVNARRGPRNSPRGRSRIQHSLKAQDVAAGPPSRVHEPLRTPAVQPVRSVSWEETAHALPPAWWQGAQCPQTATCRGKNKPAHFRIFGNLLKAISSTCPTTGFCASAAMFQKGHNMRGVQLSVLASPSS